MTAQTPPDEIRQLLETYSHSLNSSDAQLATRCYTRDGVFMPTTLPTARGPELEEAYSRIFATIRLDVKFSIDELVVTGDGVAYGLTRSDGTQTVLATGARNAEANREVFIFAVEDGVWRISRYMFNKAE